MKKCEKKTAINQGYTGLLGKTGEATNKESSRSFWNNTANRKEIYFNDKRGYSRFRSSCKLKETKILHECMVKCYL